MEYYFNPLAALGRVALSCRSGRRSGVAMKVQVALALAQKPPHHKVRSQPRLSDVMVKRRFTMVKVIPESRPVAKERCRQDCTLPGESPSGIR